MRIKRSCKVCGNEFYAIKTTQFFDQRKCFKRDFYTRTKARLAETRSHYPERKCGYCGISTQLNFDPMVNHEQFNAWRCSQCGLTNSLIWEYRNDPNSRQTIGSLLVTLQMYSSETEPVVPEYETYKLPILKLDQGNPQVVVMTCETLSIVEMQKRDRKKLTFS